MNSLGLTRNPAHRTCNRQHAPLRFNPTPHFVIILRKDRLHQTEHPNALPASERCSGQPREVLLHAHADLRQELGKECDANHAMRERLERSAQRGNPILIEPADLADVGRIDFPFADTNFTPDQSESGNGRRGAAIHPESATGSSGFHTDLPEVFKFGQSGHLRCALVHTN